MAVTVHHNNQAAAPLRDVMPASSTFDSAWRTRQLLLKASEVLGSTEKAESWLKTPNASLFERRPLDVAEESFEGYESAYAVLGRIEFGIYP